MYSHHVYTGDPHILRQSHIPTLHTHVLRPSSVSTKPKTSRHVQLQTPPTYVLVLSDTNFGEETTSGAYLL